MDFFTDLNKACPKNNFPLPRINQLVDVTAEHKLVTFMSAYPEYNQVQMYRPNREKTSFVMNKGLYCYNIMPFALKKIQERPIKNWSTKCLIARL